MTNQAAYEDLMIDRVREDDLDGLEQLFSIANKPTQKTLRMIFHIATARDSSTAASLPLKHDLKLNDNDYSRLIEYSRRKNYDGLLPYILSTPSAKNLIRVIEEGLKKEYKPHSSFKNHWLEFAENKMNKVKFSKSTAFNLYSQVLQSKRHDLAQKLYDIHLAPKSKPSPDIK